MTVLLYELATWPASAVATVIAAVLAAVGAVVASVLTLRAAGRRLERSELRTDRSQYWERLSWALDRYGAQCDSDIPVGIATLTAVYEIQWMTRGDRIFTDTVLDALDAHEDVGLGVRTPTVSTAGLNRENGDDDDRIDSA
jgi:hypothetical protein